MSDELVRTDRELLEAAAKAAGIKGTYYAESGPVNSGIYIVDELDCGNSWNPLTDDGDALRLAVKLDLSISPGQVKVGVTWWRRPGLIEQAGVVELHGADPYAATRRAIVRAADLIVVGALRKKFLTDLQALFAQRDQMREALLETSRRVEALKRECGMDPESPQALRNGQYMSIAWVARAAAEA